MTGLRLDPVAYPALTRTDLVRYAGASGDFNPLHHDPEYAARSGLPDVMAHGMLTAGLLASALTRWFGPGSVLGLSVRFRCPVWPGDMLTAVCREMQDSSTGQVPDWLLVEADLSRAGGEVVMTAVARVQSQSRSINA